MADDDTLPKYARDLLEVLLQEIPSPRWPTTYGGASGLDEAKIRELLWITAQRSLIESLMQQYELVETEAADDEDDQTYWSGYDGPRVIPEAGEMVKTAIAGAGALDPGAS